MSPYCKIAFKRAEIYTHRLHSTRVFLICRWELAISRQGTIEILERERSLEDNFTPQSKTISFCPKGVMNKVLILCDLLINLVLYFNQALTTLLQLADLSCLVYQKGTNTYAPYNKDWIKEKIYILLRRQAARWKSWPPRNSVKNSFVEEKNVFSFVYI